MFDLNLALSSASVTHPHIDALVRQVTRYLEASKDVLTRKPEPSGCEFRGGVRLLVRQKCAEK